jgi:hypothetical protein
VPIRRVCKLCSTKKAEDESSTFLDELQSAVAMVLPPGDVIGITKIRFNNTQRNPMEHSTASFLPICCSKVFHGRLAELYVTREFSVILICGCGSSKFTFQYLQLHHLLTNDNGE